MGWEDGRSIDCDGEEASLLNCDDGIGVDWTDVKPVMGWEDGRGIDCDDEEAIPFGWGDDGIGIDCDEETATPLDCDDEIGVDWDEETATPLDCDDGIGVDWDNPVLLTSWYCLPYVLSNLQLTPTFIHILLNSG